MHLEELGLFGLKLLRAKRFQDDRGWFAESFNKAAFEDSGLPGVFAQDNQSHSCRGVLRGLHFQVREPQGKLIRVLSGVIWDVAVDLRKSSPTFGQWYGLELAAGDGMHDVEALWIPEGLAHGFLVLSETADVAYKVTRPYDPGGEETVLWNDPTLAIAWPLDRLGGNGPILSAKDVLGRPFGEASTF